MSSARPGGRWLFGPGPDLWLGCGGAYAVVFVALCAAPGAVQAVAPIGLLPLLVLVTGIPHYGATLLRVYERGEDRRKYRFFALWTTLAVYAWFVLGVYEVALGSLLVTLYLTWSPWHYTGQNYGIAVMFLRRRGVDLEARTKRLLYASFVLSYAIAFLGIHGAAAGADYAPMSISGSTYSLLRIGIPQPVYAVLLPVVASLYLVASTLALLRLRRRAGWRDLAPVLALGALQALWFSLPAVARASGLLAKLGTVAPGVGVAVSLETYGLLWIATGHAVQYLWVTTYYATTADRKERKSRYLLKTWLAGCAIWGIPTFVFAPNLLGVRAFDAGLGLLVAAAVNVHHFILDGAIWKLRDGRIARVLLASHEQATARPDPVRPRAWGGGAVRALVAAVGVAYALATVVGTLEAEYGVRRASNPPDYDRLRTAAERLRWIGRDNPALRYDLGVAALQRGDLDAARRELSHSLDLGETPHSWVALGVVAERSEQWREALDAFQAALAIAPENVDALAGSARALLRLGETKRARAALQRALALSPESPELRAWLQRLQGFSGSG